MSNVVIERGEWRFGDKTYTFRHISPERPLVSPRVHYEVFGGSDTPCAPLWFDYRGEELPYWHEPSTKPKIHQAPTKACYVSLVYYSNGDPYWVCGARIKPVYHNNFSPSILAVENTPENFYCVKDETNTDQERSKNMLRKVIRVAFFNGGGFERHRSYDYFYAGDAKVGDYAVVKTDSTDGMFKVVKVVDVLQSSSKATKWAYTVFNEDTVESERLKSEKRSELLQTAEQRLKELSFLKKLEEAAKEDSSLSALVSELKSLEGN